MRAKGSRFTLYFSILTALALLVAACGKNRAGRAPASAAPAVAVPAEVAAAAAALKPLPARELSPELRAARERAMADASSLRGLEWRADVGLAPLTSAEYAERAREVADALGVGDMQALNGLAIAGGMLPEGSDLFDLVLDFAAQTTGASYSPPDRQVLLRSDDPKDAHARHRALLAHEYVHALQDQHFDTTALLLARPYNFDRSEAVFALAEGDATNVERRLGAEDAFARRSLADIARAEEARFGAFRQQLGWLFPPLLTETFISRYRDGSLFVETMRRSRPGFSVDELFRRPPASTEQVLHPEKYVAGETPREVSLDEAAFAEEGWRLAASTPLGEIGVRGLLMAGVGAEEAKRAAAGWGGDRAYAFEREGHATLFIWKTLWDRAADAQEFYKAYNALKRGASSGAGGATQAVWREGAKTTLVRVEGDKVLIVRGAEDDVTAAAVASWL